MVRTCGGCGDVVDIAFGADRGPHHGGITNFYGGTTVYCYRNPGWWRTEEVPDPPPPIPRFRLRLPRWLCGTTGAR